MSDELKPCPFCVASDAAVHEHCTGGSYMVMCHNCTAEGPLHGTKALAAKWWNRRTAPVSAPMGQELPPLTYMTADQAFEWAWGALKKDLNAERWTAGDEVQSWAFFKYGWDYRAQFERQVESPYAERIRQLERELSEHKAARIAYASEFAPDADGDPDVGSIHANIRSLKRVLAERKTASIGRDRDFWLRMNEWREAWLSGPAERLTRATDALIAYIDGRTAGTAPDRKDDPC